MPVRIPNSLPAAQVLKDENIFVMTERRARIQEIRPLKIAILNLMPTKEVTETQLLRLIGNTPLQVDVTLLRTASYQARNVSSAHLDTFYKTFDEVRDSKFDGLIITGAPVEHLEAMDNRSVLKTGCTAHTDPWSHTSSGNGILIPPFLPGKDPCF